MVLSLKRKETTHHTLNAPTFARVSDKPQRDIPPPPPQIAPYLSRSAVPPSRVRHEDQDAFVCARSILVLQEQVRLPQHVVDIHERTPWRRCRRGRRPGSASLLATGRVAPRNTACHCCRRGRLGGGTVIEFDGGGVLGEIKVCMVSSKQTVKDRRTGRLWRGARSSLTPPTPGGARCWGGGEQRWTVLIVLA